MNHIMQSFFGEECSRLLDQQSMFKAWLTVESALAASQAELGIVPQEAAKQIARAADGLMIDMDRYRAAVVQTRHPLVPILQDLRMASGEAGRYVHFGASSQDIIDSGLVLWCRPASAKIVQLVEELSRLCVEIALRHRAALMVGRTHGQHAVPTTFGLRAAVWADQLNDHVERFSAVRARLLVGSFGGASGTIAGYGDRALELRERLMRRLEIGIPRVSWHSAYERFADYIALLGLVAGTADRIAREVYLLSRPEIGELSEPFKSGMVGSSTMPHKQNPIVCEAISAAAAFVQSQVPLAQRMVSQRDDRDLSATFLAIEIVPEVTAWTTGLLSCLCDVLIGLGVNEARMKENLSLTSGAYLSERAMLRLAPLIGRDAADSLVKDCIAHARSAGIPLAEVLASADAVIRHLGREEIEQLFDPAAYIGKSTEMVESVARRRAAAVAHRSES